MISNQVKQSAQLSVLPENASTIIIILGQCSLPNGEPHPWIIDRVNTAYSLIAEQKLDLNTTYFLVSGSDVSNRQYGIFEKKKKHKSEAQIMYNLLTQIHSKTRTQQDNNFAAHIFLDQKANTTIQNFYYAFKIFDRSKIRSSIKQLYVVTSDFHMKRSQFVFQTLFFRHGRQVVGNSQVFDYKQRVHFVESKSVWLKQEEKIKKFQKQLRLLQDPFLRSEAQKTSQKLWSQLQK